MAPSTLTCKLEPGDFTTPEQRLKLIEGNPKLKDRYDSYDQKNRAFVTDECDSIEFVTLMSTIDRDLKRDNIPDQRLALNDELHLMYEDYRSTFRR